MQTARIFTSGDSQTVCLPNEIRFDEDEVVINRIGNIVLLYPRTYRAEDLLATLQDIGALDLTREQPHQLDPRASIA